MLILGLQCGHDASVAVVQDGRILLHLERERVTRRRHDGRVSAELIHEALGYCGLDAADVDLFALCTTQSFGYQSENADRLSFGYAWETAGALGEQRFRRTVFDRAAALSERESHVRDNGVQLLRNSEWPDLADMWTTGRGMTVIDELDARVLKLIFTTPAVAAATPCR